MRHGKSGVAITFMTTFVALLPAGAAEPPSAAPAAGSPGVHFEHAATASALTAAIAAGKDPAVAPVTITDQYMVNEVHRAKPTAPPAVHPGWTELHYVLEGSAVFVTGGRISSGADGKVIEGGVSRRIGKGDAVIVPANTPHWYKQIDSAVTVVEVRFIAPTSSATK